MKRVFFENISGWQPSIKTIGGVSNINSKRNQLPTRLGGQHDLFKQRSPITRILSWTDFELDCFNSHITFKMLTKYQRTVTSRNKMTSMGIYIDSKLRVKENSWHEKDYGSYYMIAYNPAKDRVGLIRWSYKLENV